MARESSDHPFPMGASGSTGSTRSGFRLVAGVALLAIVAAIGISAVLSVIASNDDGTPVFSLGVGDCIDLELPPAGPDLERVPEVPCDQPHTAEVFHIGQLDPDGDREYPPTDDILFRTVIASCVQPPEVGTTSPFEAFIGTPFSESELSIFPIAPDPAAWEPTGGRYVCLVVPADHDGTLVGSMSGSGR